MGLSRIWICGSGPVFQALVRIALQREAVCYRTPVGPKTQLPLLPAVSRRAAVRSSGIEDVEELAVDAERTAGFPQCPAMAEVVATPLVAGPSGCKPALGVLGTPRDHVDHAIYGVHSPKRRARAADHLDALDVLEHHVLDVPENSREQRRIDGATIDQHQQLVSGRIVEAARADRVGIGVDARDVEIRRDPEGFRETGRAGAADVLPGDHEYGSAGVGEPLGVFGYRGDLDVAQLFDAQIREVRDAHGLRADGR